MVHLDGLLQEEIDSTAVFQSPQSLSTNEEGGDKVHRVQGTYIFSCCSASSDKIGDGVLLRPGICS